MSVPETGDPPQPARGGAWAFWKGQLPWILGALLVVAAVIAYLLFTAPEHNPLPEIYIVL